MFKKRIKLNDVKSTIFSGHIILVGKSLEGTKPVLSIEYVIKRTEQTRSLVLTYDKVDTLDEDYARLLKSNLY